MNHCTNSVNLKKCRSCGEVKNEDKFRYIKYFKERRTICEKCEARGRRINRRDVEKHIIKHGVTQGILERIKQEVNEKSYRQASEKMLAILSQKERIVYRCARLIDKFFLFVLWLSGLFGFFSIVVAFCGYSGYYKLLIPSFLTGIVALSMHWYTCQYTKPVDLKIENHKQLIYTPLFEEAIRLRKEYERFYTSYEWKIMREKFLRNRKKANNHYNCDNCKKTIIDDFDLTIDHIKPRSKFPGLALKLENLNILCRKCNSAKGSRDIT